MNIVVIGTSDYTLRMAQAVRDAGEHLLAIISMPKAALPLNAADVRGFADKNGISYYEFADLNSPEAIALLRQLSPDYIISSWPKLLGNEMLATAKRLVIGSHPTDLPHNRGRHPLHWIIAQGISVTSLSFFRMDEGIDTGKVLHKVPIVIDKEDTIVDVLSKVNTAAYQGTMDLLKKFAAQPDYQGVDQNAAEANYWRKRTPFDVTIDLRMRAQDIVRMVNSFTQPYPFAKLIYEDKVMKIAKAKVLANSFSKDELLRMEPGKIISITTDILQVKSADEIVQLQVIGSIPANLHQAKYIHPPMKYMSEHVGALSKAIV